MVNTPREWKETKTHLTDGSIEAELEVKDCVYLWRIPEHKLYHKQSYLAELGVKENGHDIS